MYLPIYVYEYYSHGVITTDKKMVFRVNFRLKIIKKINFENRNKSTFL